jgi:anionic cell wall polymer biosynthesis LytR-Cps2A-Psr (LCP) family protein
VRINFTSFLKLIDVVGPIDVVSDYAFKGYRKGVNTLNSQQALEFARERYSLSGGDRQRGKNQQRIIEAIMAKISRPQNAVKIPQILDAIQDSIETNMSDEFVRASVRWQLNNLGNWQVSSIAVDGSGAMLVTHTYGSQPLYVMVPNEESLVQAKQAIAEQLVE